MKLKAVSGMMLTLLVVSILPLLFALGFVRLQVVYASPHTDIDATTAYNMITNGSFPNLVVLDVRTKSEYDGGHVYGAVWIPHTELEARINELAGFENHEMIVYCQSGFRSDIAAGILDSQNFTKVYDITGGIVAWQSAGHPVWIATVHNLNTTFNYDTIQAAIDAPQTIDGHTILVEAGTYYENVVVNKTLSLVGENRNTTIVDGGGTESVITVTQDNINITGFAIQNSGTNWGDSGIYLNYANYCNISNNNVRNNKAGIYLGSSSNNTLTGNIASSNNGAGIVLGGSSNNVLTGNTASNNQGTGIGISYSNNNTLTGNIASSNNGAGIVLGGSSNNNVLTGNIASSNDEDGIHLDSSNNNTLTGNIASSNNGDGIWLGWSNNNTLTDNTASNNYHGIFLSWLNNNNVLSGNNASNNNYGIRLDSSSNNVLTGNTASNNQGTGIWLRQSSNNNTLSGNNASNNNYGIWLGASSNNNTFSGNTASNNGGGIWLYLSSNNNVLTRNNASNNLYGIYLSYSSNNVLFHNNFINNTNQVSSENSTNTWDDGHPSGGNYWSDHFCTGNPSDGSQPYVIDANNIDHYPFQYPNGWLLPPVIVVLSPQNTTYTTSSVPLTFTISEPASWMGYSLDGQLNVTVAGNTTLTGLSDGVHGITLYANDTSGNMGSSSKVYFTIDTTSPTIGVPSRIPDDDILPEQEVKVSVSVTDVVSGVKNVTLSYTIDDGITWTNLPMNYNASTTLYQATIPKQRAGTWVKYKIVAHDNAENPATKDGTEPYCIYQVIPEFPTWTPILLTLIILAVVIAIYKRRLLKTPIH